jgi:hypothetical protein
LITVDFNLPLTVDRAGLSGTNVDAFDVILDQTKDGQPPRNVIIHIDGCNFATLATKAQVETRETTTVAGKLILQN